MPLSAEELEEEYKESDYINVGNEGTEN